MDIELIRCQLSWLSLSASIYVVDHPVRIWNLEGYWSTWLTDAIVDSSSTDGTYTCSQVRATKTSWATILKSELEKVPVDLNLRPSRSAGALGLSKVRNRRRWIIRPSSDIYMLLYKPNKLSCKCSKSAVANWA